MRLSSLVPATYRDVLRVDGFGRLAFGSGISSLGDGMSAVGVVWLALQLAPAGQEAVAVAVTIVAFEVPSVILGLFFGALANRLGPRRLILIGSGTRGAFLAIVPLLYWAYGINFATYVALLALSSVFDAWAVAGRTSMVADLVPEPLRLSANSLLYGQSQFALILGPALAGLVVAFAGAASVIAFDAASFGALFLIALTLPTGTRATTEEGTPESGLGQLRQIAGDRRLLVLFGVTLLFYGLYGPFDVALPLHVRENLGGGAQLLGLLLSGFGLAALLGNVAAGALGRRFEPWPTSLVVTAGWGAAVVALGLAGNPVVALAAIAIGGFIYGPHPAMIWTVLQSETRPDNIAGISAAWSSLVTLVVPVGTLLGGPLTAVLGPRGALVASGVGTVALAVVAAAVSVGTGFGRRKEAAGTDASNVGTGESRSSPEKGIDDTE